MKALIVVDMQHDFVDGALGTPEAVAVVPAVKAKIAAYRQAGHRVIFTRDTHSSDYLSTQEGRHLPVPHCIKGTPGWQILEELPTEGCSIVDKPAFGSPALAELVAAENYESVELIGLCTDICVLSNAVIIKARLPETPVLVDPSCCAGVTPQSHANAIEAMKMCQIDMVE